MLAQRQQNMFCSHLLSISTAPATALRAGSADRSSRPDGQNVTDFMFFAGCISCDLFLTGPVSAGVSSYTAVLKIHCKYVASLLKG